MGTISRKLRQTAARPAASLLPLLAALWCLSLSGCDLLDVTDPTRLEEADVANPTGADLMRKDALSRLYAAAAKSADLGGALADEYHVDRPNSFGLEDQLDVRREDNVMSTLYRDWQQVRYAATLAATRIEADAPEAQRPARIGQMLTVRAFAVLRLGEDFCPGFPLHALDGYNPVYGQPLETVDEVFERALADLDSAVVLAADSARIINFARVTRGRTLLELGRFEDAAAAVEEVPTDYVFTATFGDVASGQSNPLSRLTMPGLGPVGGVSDREGDNGLDFVSAADPRLATTYDEVYARWRPDKYLDWDAPMVLSSGVEARLVEAEVALHGGGDWLGILNALRTTCTDAATCPDPAPAGSGGVAGLPPLTDPGTPDARVDLLFRERAFWLFGTGHRLGGLRRLMRQYDRSSESLFPTGTHPRGGGIYGPATSMGFPWETEAEFNPAVTGCTDS